MIEKFSVDHLSELVAYACRKNASRESGSAFCCQTEASIQRDFSETLDFGFACREGDRLCGLLSCFPDLEKGNVDCALLTDRENYSATARQLLSAAQAQLGNHLRYTFFFPKENEACAAFLESIGACRRENEYRMVLRRDDWQPQEGLPAPHPLEEAAYAAFVALHDRVFPDVYVSGRDILEDLGKSRFVYTLEEAGNLAAYGVLHRAEDRFTAEILGVRQELRGRGFGRAILNCLAKETFCRHGAAELDLIVDADNTQALILYQKTGFQILEENRCYISQLKIAADGSCMEKETSV